MFNQANLFHLFPPDSCRLPPVCVLVYQTEMPAYTACASKSGRRLIVRRSRVNPPIHAVR